MKKKIIKIILLLILMLVIITYSMTVISVFCDEIWEYGFGYNIATGLVPYRDFNMVVTPLFPFCIALFIKIFGSYLLSAHIFNALILISTIGIMYKIIGNKALIIVPILLYSTYNILPTYNGLIMFLAVLLVYIKQINIKKDNKVILSGFIISLMVLTKQSIGIVFFILELFLTKDKKKYILAFSIPIIIFLIYLILNKALYNFIDYCILGMLDFADKNSFLSPWVIVFIIMLIILIFLYVKYRKNNILYALAFSTMCIPIIEYNHLIVWFIFSIFSIFQSITFKNNLIKYFILYTCLILILFLSCEPINIYIKKNFLYGRNIGPIEYVNSIEENSNKLELIGDEYDKVFIINGSMSYAIKLYRKEIIDKYDLINNGNIGYNGSKKYIKEIDDYCKSHKCLFLMRNNIEEHKDQMNDKIINYIIFNYNYLEKNKYISYYSN